MEIIADEEVRSTRDDASASAPSSATPEAPTTSAQQAKEGDVIPVTRLGAQL